MKHVLKGVYLGLSLVAANRLCGLLFDGVALPLALLSGLVFFAIVTAFLVSDKVEHLLACGFSGLFVMFFAEIGLLIFGSRWLLQGQGDDWLLIYVGGFYGSVVAVAVSIVMTVKQIRLNQLLATGGAPEQSVLQPDMKLKLGLYALISALSFSYLVMPERAGISVPVFVVLQLVLLWFVVPDRRRLLLMLPILFISLNCLLSASDIWRLPNLLVCLVLFSCLFMKPGLAGDSLAYLGDGLLRILAPLSCFGLPFRWIPAPGGRKKPVAGRILIALVIAIPCGLLLTMALANADMVFSLKIGDFLAELACLFSLHTVYILLCGLAAGLYLFGVVYRARTAETAPAAPKASGRQGDLIIINILLAVVLFVYTMFVLVQFKYLFAGSALPGGLSYTEYARKGFFELLALTGVNLAAILIVVRLTKRQSGLWARLTKALCHYLCAVTVVLLVSSFYRMALYIESDGLTRLRLFVIVFLVFEAAGLLLTFVYIARPKFNITLLYLFIALGYYVVLNLVPADYIIANNQIDKYLSGEREDVGYVFTLSADAAPAVCRLLEHPEDEAVCEAAEKFLQMSSQSNIPERWQRYNIAAERAKDIAGQLT